MDWAFFKPQTSVHEMFFLHWLVVLSQILRLDTVWPMHKYVAFLTIADTCVPL